MKTYTKEEKKAYYQGLRDRWTEAKKRITEHERGEIAGLIEKHGLSISPLSFYIVSMIMQREGFDGLPYLDAKTFQGWKQNGFKVKKGEKCRIKSVSWVEIKGEDEEEGFLMPKEYHLFHRSQVEAI